MKKENEVGEPPSPGHQLGDFAHRGVWAAADGGAVHLLAQRNVVMRGDHHQTIRHSTHNILRSSTKAYSFDDIAHELKYGLVEVAERVHSDPLHALHQYMCFRSESAEPPRPSTGSLKLTLRSEAEKQAHRVQLSSTMAMPLTLRGESERVRHGRTPKSR
jgi:hypothetical protein